MKRNIRSRSQGGFGQRLGGHSPAGPFCSAPRYTTSSVWSAQDRKTAHIAIVYPIELLSDPHAPSPRKPRKLLAASRRIPLRQPHSLLRETDGDRRHESGRCPSGDPQLASPSPQITVFGFEVHSSTKEKKTLHLHAPPLAQPVVQPTLHERLPVATTHQCTCNQPL
jgi:hypothetical protein